jgi:hypothetical protein
MVTSESTNLRGGATCMSSNRKPVIRGLHISRNKKHVIQVVFMKYLTKKQVATPAGKLPHKYSALSTQLY